MVKKGRYSQRGISLQNDTILQIGPSHLAVGYRENWFPIIRDVFFPSSSFLLFENCGRACGTLLYWMGFIWLVACALSNRVVSSEGIGSPFLA